MARMDEKIKTYERQNMDEITKLKEGLEKIKTDRAEQVDQFKSRFRELRSSAKGIIRRVQLYDQHYDQLVSGFFAAIDRIDSLSHNQKANGQI